METKFYLKIIYNTDHFTRILNDQDAQRKLNSTNNDLSKSQQNMVEVDKEQNDTDEKKINSN